MSVRVKIFAYLLMFCALLIALLWLFQVVFLESVYRMIKIREVSEAMSAISRNIGSDDLPALAENINVSRGVSVMIISPDGAVTVSANSFPMTVSVTRDLSRLYLLTARNGGEYLEYPYSSPAGQARVTVSDGWTIARRQQEIFHCKLIGGTMIVLSAMISPVDATVGTLKIELIFITGVMLLFSVVIALLISRHVSKPIVAISKTAKALARGRYDVAFNTRGYREITELAGTLNVAARELSTVDGLRRELVANVSHDLRTPLTLIAGYAEAMRDLPGENTPENAQIIVDEAERLSRLVAEVLDLSKLQSGAWPIVLEPFNLTRCLRGIVERLAEFTRALGYSITLAAEGDVTVRADESAISQAVYNLLTNAINFTGDDKTVAVRQIVSPDGVTVEVADTGKGISGEELPYIWDRYYRTGKKHKRAAVGTGIGLSIVKSVMERHGGEYGARTEAGRGSVFWIRIKDGPANG
ncbi:MAG: HAMP domain-containing histidine kinase [Clostridiales bacterium]|jgi:signal transduction histidine kinase|nr:HAMP domain-containing histidine kinase [Clostridiales bacterium]